MNDYTQRYKEIGLLISYYRKLKGLTQLQLAEKANISRTYISRLEAPNMTTIPSLEILFTIADALEIPVKDLLDFRSS
ncbi:MAG: helix-turn-helix domain-containing protein [Lachnospiraceae bacterium]